MSLTYRPNGNGHYSPNTPLLRMHLSSYREVRKQPQQQSRVLPVTQGKMLERRRSEQFYKR